MTQPLTREDVAQIVAEYMASEEYAPKPKRGRKRKIVVQDVEPDYDNMDLAAFGDHVTDSMGDCTQMAIDEFMKMSRAHRKGRKLKAASHAAKGVAGAALVTYGVVELLRVAFGDD